MKLILLACWIVSTVNLAEALSNAVQVRQGAEHVLHEVGYPVIPKLVKEVMTGILMLQPECPRYASDPMVFARALVKKYKDMPWEAWEKAARDIDMAAPEFARVGMKIIHLSMVDDLRKSPLEECR